VSWEAIRFEPAIFGTVTALSAATFFTLLAQGRLVDDASSTEMRDVLKLGCVTSLFPYDYGLFPAKCGILPPDQDKHPYWNRHNCREVSKRTRLEMVHDNVLVERDTIHYAISVLTYPKHDQQEWELYSQLCNELENLIVKNNQTPKSAC
jgi:hypothetical protein